MPETVNVPRELLERCLESLAGTDLESELRLENDIRATLGLPPLRAVEWNREQTEYLRERLEPVSEPQPTKGDD